VRLIILSTIYLPWRLLHAKGGGGSTSFTSHRTTFLRNLPSNQEPGDLIPRKGSFCGFICLLHIYIRVQILVDGFGKVPVQSDKAWLIVDVYHVCLWQIERCSNIMCAAERKAVQERCTGGYSINLGDVVTPVNGH
jgi:hypothetical protein